MNWCGFSETALEHFVQDVSWHGGFFEGEARLWDAVTVHSDLMLGTPTISILVRSVGDIRVFVVEVLLENWQFRQVPVDVSEVGS